MYTVGMNNIQYTIRGIPTDLDSALHLRAKKRGQSFNAIVIEALKKGALFTDTKKKTNLDWFYGSGDIGAVEEEAFAAQRLVNPKDWV
jgi:plasmid stability protein